MQPLLQGQSNKYYIFWVCVHRFRYRMRCACAILSPVACLALQYFSTLSHKQHDVQKKDIKLHFDFLYKFVWNISHSKNNSATYVQKCILVFMQSARYSCQISIKLQFSLKTIENTQIYFMKIRPLWAELFHADGQTGGDRHTTKTRGVLRNFVNAP